ncbi:MAG: hypothetical protein K9H64_09095 [Bacteroidales bacterium]|nr:hypothetical protein [Bacteroidales bacterium]MCF8456022.1 hypothetical protein [Bacteroidales bacterium]
MAQQGEIENGKKIKVLYLSIIAVLIIVIGIISYLYKKQVDETEVKIAEVIKTTQEKAEIKAELNTMYAQYDSIKTDNDSLILFREEQKEKIISLLNSINNKNFEIRTYKKEVNTMRTIMKDYIVQIDSLNTRNQILIAENKEVKEKFKKERNTNEQLQSMAKELEGQIELASSLKAKDIVVETLRKRDRETKSAKRVEKIKICFNLPDNAIAPSGDKTIYVRIARPDELVLTESENNLFLFEEKEIVYSATRVVEYNNMITNDACIFYDNKGELIEGTYAVDIFLDGKLIGESEFTLR